MFISVLVVITINGYFYISYGFKIYENLIVNKQLRNSIMSKVKPYEGSWNGNIAKNLTFIEYREITKYYKFPPLPMEANHISYEYEYEGFLPDYSFKLTYDLPITSKIDEMKYTSGTFSKRRILKIIGNKKRITYYEELK